MFKCLLPESQCFLRVEGALLIYDVEDRDWPRESDALLSVRVRYDLNVTCLLIERTFTVAHMKK